jgi:ubiquinone/menaquinone biosynthesis C-methylase UbiE
LVQSGKRPPLLYRFLKIFFDLLYGPFAWTYDLVAWIVSLGRWKLWIYSVLPELDGPRVLELGHGPGHLQAALGKKGLQTFGIDLSPQMGRNAARRLHQQHSVPTLVRASGEHQPFKSNSFHQLVATFPTEYILNPKTLAEARRVLKKTGKMVILPVAWIAGGSLSDRGAAWLFRSTGQAREWNPTFGTVLRAAGFQVEEKRIKVKGSEVMLVIAQVKP